MDPTTKEGREALVSGLRRMSCPPERRCGPQSKRLQVPCDCLVTEGAAAALSRIEKLEKERDALQHGLGKSLEVALREREEVLAERDTLRAELERARKALRKAAGYVTGPETESLSAVKTEITAVLSPSAPVTGEAPTYEPSEAERLALRTALASYGVHVASKSEREILIAAAKARSKDMHGATTPVHQGSGTPTGDYSRAPDPATPYGPSEAEITAVVESIDKYLTTGQGLGQTARLALIAAHNARSAKTWK